MRDDDLHVLPRERDYSLLRLATVDGRAVDSAALEYVVDMVAQLEVIARGAGYDALADLLDAAHSEAVRCELR